jgi:hypothetical protein
MALIHGLMATFRTLDLLVPPVCNDSRPTVRSGIDDRSAAFFAIDYPILRHLTLVKHRIVTNVRYLWTGALDSGKPANAGETSRA